MKYDETVTVKEFLTEIGIQKILEVAESKYEMYSELYLAFMKCFGALTRSQSKVTPKYVIRYMYRVPRNVKFENIYDVMVNYCRFASIKSDRSFKIDKSRVKSIADFANAKVELVEEEGAGGLSYAEQAAILLLSFCVLDEDVIEAYADGIGVLSAVQLMSYIKR